VADRPQGRTASWRRGVGFQPTQKTWKTNVMYLSGWQTMKITRLEVGPLATNAYLLKDEASSEGAVIDPGAEGARIARRCEEVGLVPLYIINTHAHPDHIGGNAALKQAFPAAQVCMSRGAAIRLADADTDMAVLLGAGAPSPAPELLLEEGDELPFGQGLLRVLSTPGHMPGSICLLTPRESPQHLFCGDLLFQNSVGRTDFVGGDPQALMASLKEKVMTLPDETIVHPGHGPETTVGQERRNNPYLPASVRRAGLRRREEGS